MIFVSCSLQLPIILGKDSVDTDQLDDTDHSQSGSDRSMADTLTVKLLVKCAKGVHLNEEAPNSWKLSSEGTVMILSFRTDKPGQTV